ncbi:MAG: hypothetical protein BAJATHORv1_30278 [Candidatus Thorarchaeota archaeon]|nr:MAG: hypothetical protein BAJATHORv1_30278 [Candidatus Thorarchaeota archaeon]
MPKITIKCVCGEIFQPDIDLERYKEELSRTGLIPLLVSHKDHFVTVYLDKNGSVRGVERIILVEDDTTTQVASEEFDIQSIQKTVLDLAKDVDPSEEYEKYVSILLFKIKQPEALFVAGEIIGRRMWMKWREAILRLGAKYVPKLDLIIKTELKPLLDKVGTANLHGNNEVLITNCTAPQFVVGLAQGVLNAISAAAKSDIRIKIEYSIEANNVMLTVVT